MAKVGTAEYDVEISRAKVQAEVDATSRQIEQGLGRSATKVRDEFSNSARVAVAGFGAFAAANVIGDTIDAASDLAEQQSKVGVVFGDSANQVLAFGTNAEQSLGQSERAALEAAGTFGNLFRSVGISERESARLSVSLTALASDLASFNNTSVDDALTALRAGLVGETEPLKRFGVNLNEAELKAKALELGLYEGVGAIDANAKAQAAYALIVEQTTLAQGDFERTSDSLANQQRILSAEWENAQAQLGEELIPSAKVAVGVFGDLLSVVSALPAPLVAGGVALGGVVVAFGLLGPVVRTGWAELTSFTTAEVAAAGATKGTTAALIAETEAMNARNAAMGYGTVVTGGSLTRTARLKDAYLNAGGAAGIMGKGVIALTAGLVAYEATAAGLDKLVDFEGDSAELQRALAALGSGTGDVDTAVNELGGNVEDLAEKFGDAFAQGSKLEALRDLGFNPTQTLDTRQAQSDIAALDEQLAALYAQDPQAAIRAYTEIRNALTELGVPIDNITTELPTITDLIIDGGTSAGEAASGYEQLAEDVAKAKEALRDEFDAQREVNDASRDVILAVDELNKAKQDAVTGGEAYTDALREEADAKQAAVDAGRAVADAQRNEADAVRDVQRAQEDLTEARKRATEALEDLQFAAEGAVLSEERAQLRLQAAIEDQKRVGRDPKSTERDRQEADLAVREAELALREAQDRKGDSAEELAQAEANGIEQSDEVVAAKERVEAALQAQVDASQSVTDALADQRAAEDRVREATAKSAQVLVDAKGRVEEAARNLEEKILDEADAQAELAEITGDATDANEAYNDSLERSAALLDPNSAFRQNLRDYLDDVAELGTISGLDPAVSPVPGRDPDAGPRPPRSLPAGESGPRSITNNITVNSNVSPKELADHLAFAQGGN